MKERVMIYSTEKNEIIRNMKRKENIKSEIKWMADEIER